MRRVKTLVLPGLDEDSLVNDPDCGGSSPESSTNLARASSSSKTSRVVHVVGCPRCGVNCTCLDTTPPPTRFLPQSSVRRTCDDGSSLLPTLSAATYGSNRGGANGRSGPDRPSLETLAKRGLLPTLTRRDEKGPGPKHTKGGSDLPQALGGHLSADWCRWFMGFPVGWLDVDDVSESAPSATASFRSAPR